MEIKFPCGVVGRCYCQDCEDDHFCHKCTNRITEFHWDWHKRGLELVDAVRATAGAKRAGSDIESRSAFGSQRWKTVGDPRLW